MENASKALLIAGAVLICILLIGVGVAIFRQSKDVTNQVGNVSDSMNTKASEKAQNLNLMFEEIRGE